MNGEVCGVTAGFVVVRQAVVSIYRRVMQVKSNRETCNAIYLSLSVSTLKTFSDETFPDDFLLFAQSVTNRNKEFTQAQ